MVEVPRKESSIRVESRSLVEVNGTRTEKGPKVESPAEWRVLTAVQEVSDEGVVSALGVQQRPGAVQVGAVGHVAVQLWHLHDTGSG